MGRGTWDVGGVCVCVYKSTYSTKCVYMSDAYLPAKCPPILKAFLYANDLSADSAE